MILILKYPFTLLIYHIIISQLTTRLYPKSSRQIICLAAGMISMAKLLVSLATHGAPIAEISFYFIYCLGVSYSYFHFFNMSETARRIKILTSIQLGKIKTLQDLNQFYQGDKMLSIRMQRLLDMKKAILDEKGRYQLNGQLLASIAQFMEWLKRLLRLEDGA